MALNRAPFFSGIPGTDTASARQPILLQNSEKQSPDEDRFVPKINLPCHGSNKINNSDSNMKGTRLRDKGEDSK